MESGEEMSTAVASRSREWGPMDMPVMMGSSVGWREQSGLEFTIVLPESVPVREVRWRRALRCC